MELYEVPRQARTRWVSFENGTGARGKAALQNRGGKGHAFDRLSAGEAKTLLEVTGGGEVRRIWMTVSDRSPRMLRSLRLDMFWDGSSLPAVSCPLGDFFGVGLGRRCAFECQLFSDPEGRSFNCFIPMPFRSGARITLTNESDKDLSHLFYDLNLVTGVEPSPEALHFHAHWRRESPNELGQEYTILPRVSGRGRFLGSNVGVIGNPVYGNTWWGEGEVKVWFGDDAEPTLCGTGTEDYIGTAWGQGKYANRTQGCPIADPDNRQWAFYRHHLDDPIYFDDACRVAIQTIGGTGKDRVIELLGQGVPLRPVSIDASGTTGEFVRLLDMKQPVDLSDPAIPDGWCNFWRQDDWSSTAYLYLDSASGALPALQTLEERVRDLAPPE